MLATATGGAACTGGGGGFISAVGGGGGGGAISAGGAGGISGIGGGAISAGGLMFAATAVFVGAGVDFQYRNSVPAVKAPLESTELVAQISFHALS